MYKYKCVKYFAFLSIFPCTCSRVRGRRRRKIGNYEIEKYVFMSKNLHIAISDLRRTNDILCCLEKKIQLHTNTEL